VALGLGAIDNPPPVNNLPHQTSNFDPQLNPGGPGRPYRMAKGDFCPAGPRDNFRTGASVYSYL
jgi:hypothetical protein